MSTTYDLALDPGYFAEKVQVNPNGETLAFVAGICTAPAKAWKGQSGGLTNGDLTYTALIKVDTKLNQASWAVAQVGLASISDASWADNAAWRIDRPYVVDISGGIVTVLVTVNVHDKDGYLDALSVGVQAAGDGPGCS
jgi:hypothetical protein